MNQRAFYRIILATMASFSVAEAKPLSSKKIEFQYTDGLFGTYTLATTPRSVKLKAGQRVVSFDIKKCNQKLIDVYLGRVQKSLTQLVPALRDRPQNRVTMNRRTYRVALNSPAAPFLRNLPSETYYLSRLQTDLCRKTRVPAGEDESAQEVLQFGSCDFDDAYKEFDPKPCVKNQEEFQKKY